MNMKIINMRVLAALMLCVCGLLAQAQPEASVAVQLTNATNAVEVSQVLHALKGAGARYTFSLIGESDSIRRVTAATYTLAGPNGSTNGTVTARLTRGVVTFEPVTVAASAMAAPGEYVLTFSLQYDKGKWNENVSQASLTATAQTVHIWDTPSSAPSTATTFNDVPNGEYRDLGVTATGGYTGTNGWTYAWSTGETTPTNHHQAINTTSSTRTETVTVTVVNMAPDGVTQWYSGTHTFKLTILAVPYAELSTVPTDIINGDKVPMSWTTIGGMDTYWRYDWKVNGTSRATTKSYEYTGANTSNNGSVVARIETTASYVPSSSIYSNPQTRNINVWATPMIVSQSATEIVTCSGRTETMSITKQGGVTNGWRYQWYRGNTAVSGATGASYSPTLSNTTNSMQTVTYRVEAINTCAGKERFRESRSFTVRVYPAPRVDTRATYDGNTVTACYVGDQVTLVASAIGGNPDGWAYRWDDGKTGTSTTKTMPNSISSNPTQQTYYVTVTNTYNGVQWYNQQVPVTVNVYNRGTVTRVPMDSTHFLSGQPINLRSTVSGGYPGGWIYSWREGSNNIAGTSNNNTVTATNSSNSYVDKVYTLTAINQIGNNVGSTTTLNYNNIRVWPALNLPTSFTCSAMSHGNKVRQGDQVTCGVDQATGGYNNSWQYYWTRNGQEVARSRSFYETARLQNASGTTMTTEDVVYGLNISQYGPYDHMWANKDYTTTVRVYRCPELPLQVVRKGDGTTHTLIVMTGEDEATMLETRQYTYRFGYTDMNGVDHLSEPVARRYFQMSQNDFNNSDGRIWAVAQWQYSDGETVTSGRRFVNGEYDTSFNASSFVTPRRNYAPFVEAQESGIDDVAGTASSMVVTGNRLRASFGTMTDVTVAVYDLRGHTLSTLSLPNQTHVDIALGLDNLPRGMYVVEMRAGDTREVQKVVIR